MANEVTLSASLHYEDNEYADHILEVLGRLGTVATKKVIKHKMSVGTSEEAIPLGECSSPGYAIFINRDPTNFINLKVATSGAIFAKLHADTNADGKGGVAVLFLGSGAQAPYAIADTAACQMEYLLCQT